jgi:hypothetical protein
MGMSCPVPKGAVPCWLARVLSLIYLRISRVADIAAEENWHAAY